MRRGQRRLWRSAQAHGARCARAAGDSGLQRAEPPARGESARGGSGKHIAGAAAEALRRRAQGGPLFLGFDRAGEAAAGEATDRARGTEQRDGKESDKTRLQQGRATLTKASLQRREALRAQRQQMATGTAVSSVLCDEQQRGGRETTEKERREKKRRERERKERKKTVCLCCSSLAVSLYPSLFLCLFLSSKREGLLPATVPPRRGIALGAASRQRLCRRLPLASSPQLRQSSLKAFSLSFPSLLFSWRTGKPVPLSLFLFLSLSLSLSSCRPSSAHGPAVLWPRPPRVESPEQSPQVRLRPLLLCHMMVHSARNLRHSTPAASHDAVQPGAPAPVPAEQPRAAQHNTKKKGKT